MKKEMAILVFKLVDEGAEQRNEKILQELRNWFREDAVSIPWAKELRGVTVKEE